MWPTQSVWARASYKPNCEEVGHRFGMIHFIAKRTVFMHKCRRCGKREYRSFDLVDGKILEKKLIISTQEPKDAL
jgi:hypothetical protein